MCVEEIRGTPKEAETNALSVEDVMTMYQSQIDLQSILDLEQEVSKSIEYTQRTK